MNEKESADSPSAPKDDRTANQQPEGKDNDKKEQGNGSDGDNKKKPSRAKFLLIGGVIFVLIAVAAVILWLRGRTREGTDDAYVTAHVHQISARVAGTVEKVLVDDNQVVKEGDPLVTLDPRDNQVALQKAQAGMLQAQAETLQARAKVTEARAKQTQAGAEATQAQAQAAQSAAQLDVASVNFNRNRSLFQKDARAVAKADVDTTKSSFDASQAAYDAAKAMYDAALANAGAAAATATSAEAQVTVAEANEKTAATAVHDAELQLSYTTVIAPVAGRVSRKTVEAGQRLAPGQALMAVVENNVWILANFKETQLGRLQIGDRVEIKIDAFPKHEFTGKVNSFQAGSGATFSLLPPDNATGNFTKIVQRVPVKIVFDPDSIRGFEDRVVPGLSVEPTVRISER